MPCRLNNFLILPLAACLGTQIAAARDGLKINIPRRSELTPVQKLNREGVDAVRKNQFDKAGALFYKAYLYDPTDPFTLNNLGYVAELQGQLERAQIYYDLASKQGSNADIDRSNAKSLEGRPMKAALENLQDATMRVNRMNIDAMVLLSQNRAFEAASLLNKALNLDRQNAFTLNNLGVADEAVGDFDDALRNYSAAADQQSSEPVVVTLDNSWRGRKVSEMAADSARRLRKHIQNMEPSEVRSLKYTMQGVAAVNRNDWSAAREAFLQAYSINPYSAFALNNRGYVAEHDGDLETAQFFYEKARRAPDAEARIGIATERIAEGKPLAPVALESNRKVDDQLEQYSRQRRQENGPIELTPRGGSDTPEQNPTPQSQQPPTSTLPH
jgi:Flp pilus assembly protein TadD